MGSYTVIADAGEALARLLRQQLAPKVIPNADAIGLATPADKGDLVLCIHLYDISESEEFRMSGMVPDGLSRQKFPPSYLTLSYMITAFSTSDIKFRAGEEQRILGGVIRALRDYPVLDPQTMEFGSEGVQEGIHIGLRHMEIEDKEKLWNFPNVPPRLSLYYQLGPVPLESGRTKEISRVADVEFRAVGEIEDNHLR